MFRTIEPCTDSFCRLMTHAPGGGPAFDSFSRFAVRAARLDTVIVRTGSTLHWGGGPAEIARLHPGLKIVQSFSTWRYRTSTDTPRTIGRWPASRP
ncbi:hypothetical protein ACFVT2_31490 [Streptomyces sp. NPDC058000]|uniref:hypothetical protein n=1 Tax=Streptomyces sp. NPDC058000 TaxID=3346299 RepID=UPI0036E16804